jgi:putative endonuclease
VGKADIKMLKRKIGDMGENLAVKKLKRMGYKIIERNFLTKTGEIDIIARDGKYLVFVEVRVRNNGQFGSGAETVDKIKQRKIIRTSLCYLQRTNSLDVPVRFDVVSISDLYAKNPSVEVIQNAFETIEF